MLYIGASGDELLPDTRDHWAPIEIDQLRDDVESAEMGEAQALEQMERHSANATHWESMHRQLKATVRDTIQEANKDLYDKNMIYLSLINEYETILAQYVRYHGVLLTTIPTAIDDLRRRGGLSV